MAQRLTVHRDNPQPRLLRQAAQLIEHGGVAAIPTDSCYALVCRIDDKAAADRVRRIRSVDERHHLTLLCRDLSEIANYAKLDNVQYRMIRNVTPGPYTFILEATREVPRRVSHPSRRTIGLRVPEHPVTGELLGILGQPLLATTLIAPGESEPLNDPEQIRERFGKVVGLLAASSSQQLTLPVMDKLLGLESRTSWNILSSMRSVVSIEGDVARFTHLTVREFLTDESRRGQPWSIDLAEQQLFISTRTFEIMEDARVGLKFNICGLESSYVPNSDVVGLERRIEERISPELAPPRRS